MIIIEILNKKKYHILTRILTITHKYKWQGFTFAHSHTQSHIHKPCLTMMRPWLKVSKWRIRLNSICTYGEYFWNDVIRWTIRARILRSFSLRYLLSLANTERMSSVTVTALELRTGPVYVHVEMHLYVCLCVCMYVCLHACLDVLCMSVYMSACTDISFYVDMHLCTHRHMLVLSWHNYNHQKLYHFKVHVAIPIITHVWTYHDQPCCQQHWMATWLSGGVVHCVILKPPISIDLRPIELHAGKNDDASKGAM